MPFLSPIRGRFSSDPIIPKTGLSYNEVLILYYYNKPTGILLHVPDGAALPRRY